MIAPPRGPPAARPSNRYTPAEGMKLTQSGNGSVHQLFCALDYMAAFIQGKGLTYAVIGGMARTLRGSRRETHDVDIAVACDMDTLRKAFNGEQRVKVPIGPPSGVMRVFVEVGPAHGDNVSEQWIQVDLFLAGFFRVPKDLTGNTEIVPVLTSAEPEKCKEFNVLCTESDKKDESTA
ncbi:hypothetical protein PG991_013778 [Apiospora marii]|uniref:Polymerase nucleotidyl transferase domain-containing protein n=1 Tax=Apiospora marii TaxID=335849 RepID=A0ABR1R703_9PEZI